MWLKVLLCILIVAFCTFMGYFAAGKYRARRKFYAQLAAFNERYLNELEYARRPLGAFLKEQNYTGDFARILGNYATSRRAEATLNYLTKEEQSDCADYLAMLGTGDALSQRSFFSSQKAPIGEKRSESEKSAEERGKLYLKLGLLAGLAFVILIL